MGDRYGPTLITREPTTLDDLRGRTIAIPGKLTTAYLTLQLCLGKDVPVDGHAVRPDPPGRGRGAGRGGPDHPRGAALLRRQGPAQGRRPRPVVVRADRPAAAAGGQRRPQGPGRRPGRADRPAPEGRASSTPWSTARRPSTTPCSTPATSTRPWPTGSWGCTSTTGRSITARAGARRSGRFWTGPRKRV